MKKIPLLFWFEPNNTFTMHYEENKATWNELAELYKEKFNKLTIYNHTYDKFCLYVNNHNAAILDIGCGPGTISEYLFSKNNQYVLYGTDVAPNMVALAKKTVPEAYFEELDCRNLDKITQQFDGIICGFCLPYIEPIDSKKFMCDVYQLLKENGIFYLSFVAGNPDLSHYQTGSSGHTSFFYFYDLNEIKQQAYAIGFRELETIEIAYPLENPTATHTITLWQKKQL